MSPFEYTKSITQTKEDLSTSDDIFDKDYSPFMVNRILANSPTTALFAGAMNQLSDLPKYMQYKFYMSGVPKSNTYTKYIKKEETDINQEHIDYICRSLNVSVPRAIEMYSRIGPDAIENELEKRGGRK
jgi:Bacteriophage clamp loader A subunit